MRYLLFLACGCAGWILLLASGDKIRARAGGQRMMFEWMPWGLGVSQAAAFVLAASELLLGCALVVGVYLPMTAVVAGCFFGAMTLFTTVGVRREPDAPCNCGGLLRSARLDRSHAVFTGMVAVTMLFVSLISLRSQGAANFGVVSETSVGDLSLRSSVALSFAPLFLLGSWRILRDLSRDFWLVRTVITERVMAASNERGDLAARASAERGMT